MKENRITEENIRNLVDTFYAKVKTHTEIGPIFLKAIDDDNAWTPHLQKMYDFWSSVMLGSGLYHGNPLQKHRMLPAFDIALFDIWLALFAECARELYIPGIADKFIEKSQRIANSLKFGLYFSPQNEDKNWLP